MFVLIFLYYEKLRITYKKFHKLPMKKFIGKLHTKYFIDKLSIGTSTFPTNICIYNFLTLYFVGNVRR